VELFSQAKKSEAKILKNYIPNKLGENIKTILDSGLFPNDLKTFLSFHKPRNWPPLDPI
jgi:hypothetical protein